MFQNAHLIFNPISGQGNSSEELLFIRNSFEEAGVPLTVLETKPDKPADELAKVAVANAADCVIASGGDGTVSAVSGELAFTEICLGIIPRGTANAIASAFGISDNIAAACQTILSGIPRTIDMASCNRKPLLLLAGIGLEAEVVSQANRQLKNRIGTAAYILSAFQQVRDISTFKAELETPDRIITVEASGITIANTAPATSVLAHGPSTVVPYDGLLDITIFSPRGTGSAIAASYNLFQSALNKRAAQREDIGYFRCAAICIATDSEQKVVLDGEMIGTTPVEVECVPQSLLIMTPQNGEFDPLENLQGLPGLTITEKK